MTSTNAITRRIIDTSTEDLHPGYETGETSQAKNTAYEILEYDYIADSGDAITAADRVVEALIKAGWRPTVEEPAAEHHGEPNADDPTDAEVEAAARATYRCDWSKDGFQDPECVWDEEGPEYRQLYLDEARAALEAARKAAQR